MTEIVVSMYTLGGSEGNKIYQINVPFLRESSSICVIVVNDFLQHGILTFIR